MGSFRVILVGRTGLDEELRRERDVELVRVRAPSEAIMELGTPIDEESPGEAVVVVSEEAQERLLSRAAVRNGVKSGRGRMVEFIRGLRMVDPNVRVVGVEGEGRAEASDLFDGVIRAGMSGEAVSSALRTARSVPRTEIEPVPAPIEVPPAEPETVEAVVEEPTSGPDPASPAGVGGGIEGDAVLVESLLKGQDVVGAAVELLRSRTGEPGLEFVPGAGEPAGGGVRVAWAGATHGWLTGARSGRDLSAGARWLAGWIRVRDQQAQLREAAFTDPLTGAWNRRYFDRFLPWALEHAKRERWDVTILLFDIDDFKRYNDEYGHEAGDEILVETVRLLRSVTRPDDRICRIGGDEFAVVFHDPKGPRTPDSRHPASVADIAERFRAQIRSHRFPKLSDCAPGTLTISGGLATFPWDGRTVGELLAIADERAMESKRAGKNAITLGPGATAEG